MISPRYPRACLLIAALAMLALPAYSGVATGEQQSASSDWYQLYTSAKDDIKRQAWAEAEKKLLQAKQSGPSQGPRTLVRGGLIVTFSADYYLGEVYLGQGRLKDAIAAFDAAGKQNLNVRAGEFARLGENRTSAVTRLTDDLIRAAQADVTSGNLSAARTKAAEARSLGGNATGVENLLAGIKAAEDRASTKNADSVNPGTPGQTKEVTPPVAPEPEPTAPPYGKPGTTTTPDDKKPGPVAATVKPAQTSAVRGDALAERLAMRQFFSGDYAGAITTLTPLSTPRALFYRSCSRAGLALLSGGGDPATLSLARQEYRDALVESTNFSRDEPYISPRVLQLLQTKE